MVASLTLIDLVASGKRERNISMYQLHYLPANAYAAPPTLHDETEVKYRLVLVE